MAYEITDESVTALESSGKSAAVVTQKGADSRVLISPFFGVVGLMWLLSMFRRRR